MDLEGVFVVISDNDQARFTTRFAHPMRVEDGFTLGVKSVYYGEICNVCEYNNKVYLQLSGIEAHISLTVGRYNYVGELLKEIHSKVNAYIGSVGESDASSIKFSAASNKWQLNLPTNIEFVKSDKVDSALNLLVISDGLYSSIHAPESKLLNDKHIGFLYCSIVQDSFINGRPSRLLATFPIISSHGYNFYEFTNPTYHPVAIKQFSDILFELRDIKGDLLHIRSDTSTVLTMHMRKTL